MLFRSPILLPPPAFPSIRVFSNESALRITWPKYWSFSFNISPSKEHPELISVRTDWLDLLAVQATVKSLLQHHSLKASILWCSAFFIVQLSGKTIALARLCWQSNVFASFYILFFLLYNVVLVLPCIDMNPPPLFIIVRTWKQPRCPSADEWIRKLWYIYTMEYYSAIKTNTFVFAF